MKPRFVATFLMALLWIAPPSRGGNEGHGGDFEIGEFIALGRSGLDVLNTFEDVLQVDPEKYQMLIRSLALGSFAGSELEPMVRRRNDVYEINSLRWGQLTLLSQRQSFALNFYLERLREEFPNSLPSKETFSKSTGGQWGSPRAFLSALDLLQVQKHTIDALKSEDFANAKAADMTVLGPLVLSLSNVWIVTVDEAFLRGERKTAINFQNRELKLILLSKEAWEIALRQKFAIGRLAQIALHEFIGPTESRELNHYEISGDFLALVNKMPRFPDSGRQRIRNLEDPRKFGRFECRNLLNQFGFAVVLSEITNPNTQHGPEKQWTLQLRDPQEMGNNHLRQLETLPLDFKGMPRLRGVLRFAATENNRSGGALRAILTIDTETKSKSFLGNAVLSSYDKNLGFLGDLSLSCIQLDH